MITMTDVERCDRCAKSRLHNAPMEDFCLCADDSVFTRADAVLDNAEFDAKKKYPDHAYGHAHAFACQTGFVFSEMRTALARAYESAEGVSR